MFSKNKIPSLSPLSIAEVRGYVEHHQYMPGNRMLHLGPCLGRNFGILSDHRMTTEQIVDGILDGCPYIDRETLIRDTNTLLMNFDWRIDPNGCWYERKV